MAYTLTFTYCYAFVNQNQVTSPYTLKDGDVITINSGSGTKVNNVAYSSDTTLNLSNQNILINGYPTSGSDTINITINFSEATKIVSIQMLSHFKDKLFQQKVWTFPSYITFQFGHYTGEGADVTLNFPSPIQSGHNDLTVAVNEDTLRLNPHKIQTLYAYNDTMLRFSYFDKDLSEYYGDFRGISLMGESIASTYYMGKINFENEYYLSQIYNYDTDILDYTFKFVQKDKRNNTSYIIKFPAKKSGTVLLEEEGITYFTSENLASNDLIDVMFN